MIIDELRGEISPHLYIKLLRIYGDELRLLK